MEQQGKQSPLRRPGWCPVVLQCHAGAGCPALCHSTLSPQCGSGPVLPGTSRAGACWGPSDSDGHSLNLWRTVAAEGRQRHKIGQLVPPQLGRAQVLIPRAALGRPGACTGSLTTQGPNSGGQGCVRLSPWWPSTWVRCQEGMWGTRISLPSPSHLHLIPGLREEPDGHSGTSNFIVLKLGHSEKAGQGLLGPFVFLSIPFWASENPTLVRAGAGTLESKPAQKPQKEKLDSAGWSLPAPPPPSSRAGEGWELGNGGDPVRRWEHCCLNIKQGCRPPRGRP